ncbi:hypothetical protein EMIHUDRAFT_236012 [Emiliania huxleyi CCMP1516]|uniref:Secreted protein n=2 Tax=Emiliania huxleyi TaxID=2903 RepID=A0A0D3JUW0_EMIH1|nr:hypothetical protein EMIHUDRAFT_236012 [Emiliania huxleyi CCMP1516]EOD27295.1 hypothetical protein EMIHUDRAFT_236012 [Emiliania huxleyi CCMP1516]|eukprot:XP_005779724.1 hypothetical protein EMIHUDRAFT_236012 [Emiliania huxleyi CCMP1516]
MRMLFLVLAVRSGAGVAGSELLQRREWPRGVVLGLSRGRDHYAVLAAAHGAASAETEPQQRLQAVHVPENGPVPGCKLLLLEEAVRRAGLCALVAVRPAATNLHGTRAGPLAVTAIASLGFAALSARVADDAIQRPAPISADEARAGALFSSSF